MRRKKLEKRYGVSLDNQIEVPKVEESEVYVEYDHSGNIVKGNITVWNEYESNL